MVRCDANYRA